MRNQTMNFANFITVALVGAGIFLAPLAAARDKLKPPAAAIGNLTSSSGRDNRVCVRHVEGIVSMRVRAITLDYKYATKWSHPISYGRTGCVDISKIPVNKKFRAEILPYIWWGKHAIARCPEGITPDRFEKAWRAGATALGKSYCRR